MFRSILITFLCLNSFFLNAQKKSKFVNLVDSANKYEHIDWSLSYSYAKMALQNKDTNFSYKDVISLNTIFAASQTINNETDSTTKIVSNSESNLPTSEKVKHCKLK